MSEFKGYVNGTDDSSAGWHPVGDEGQELVNFKGIETVVNHKVAKEQIIQGLSSNKEV